MKKLTLLVFTLFLLGCFNPVNNREMETLEDKRWSEMNSMIDSEGWNRIVLAFEELENTGDITVEYIQ